ncbi:hypothetical protein VTO42DRAFT_5163 [Malbranchea cinnamomea]
MKISQLYIYPIKSLRPTRVDACRVTQYGVDYDRRFMLLRQNEADGSLANMHIGRTLSLGLFSTQIIFPSSSTKGSIIVTYRPPQGSDPSSRSTGSTRSMEIPLQPCTQGLEEFTVTMHQSATTAYKMPVEYSGWFSECLGFPVVLAYLGENKRPVLGNLMPASTTVKDKNEGGSWVSSVLKSIPYIGTYGGLGETADCTNTNDGNKLLTFADIAPYLVVSETSLADVSSRLPDGEEMDVTKFRPNIVVSGAETAYEEDFWAELTVRSVKDQGKEVKFALTNNCARCVSINVDYETGARGAGEAGTVLKKMMKDRRVDKGMKWSPVFGRYGFLQGDFDTEGFELRVGDEVEVTKRNKEHTVFEWPGMRA